ncbi:testis-expressed protein 51 isoform X2 [Talpa occidentalis]|uniref:testis-expressed protein 51 isoform X2 n=1 Tax=Talpa occidentalis TaxID=50954 RepID=UPI00188DEE09|nr:testis-expressed protein 51 isoform X2 [Talpa occidentalis]
MLLLLLGCFLPATLGKRCLHCWPELSALMDYDLQILWGTPGPPTELSQSIHNMFLNKQVSPQLWYLGQDQLEEEAAILFIQIDEAIKRLRDDRQQLMDEIQIQKQMFAEKLIKRSEELKEKACNNSCEFWTTEVMNCVSCEIHYLTCHDSTLCPVKRKWDIVWAVIFSISLLLATMAGGGVLVWWIEKKKKKKAREGQARLSSPLLSESSFSSESR